MIPRATYRLQFRNGVDFAKAVEIIPYLRSLGISHLYASPLFAAVAGSTHGYDVIDNNLIEPALGGMAGLVALSQALKHAGMGLILDIVPNHMAASLQNPWWRDVIEWGTMSPYANYFDVDWRRKLTLPILASDFADALRAGEVGLKFDEANAGLALTYFDNKMPLHPSTYADAVTPINDGFARNLLAVAANARPDNEWKNELRSLHATSSFGDFDRRLAAISHDRSHVAKLHDLQPWRLIGWRDAGRALSYRRFFEIAGLAGLRVEDNHVFDAVHRLTFTLIEEGIVQGLRIDHVDGLADPRLYLERLRAAVGPELYVVVEKILGEEEALPADWPVHGTTGYEFIPAVAEALINPQGRCELENAYVTEAPSGADLEAERRKAKLLMLRHNFSGELNRLVELARSLDDHFEPEVLAQIISEVIAAFPVYRTYGDTAGLNARDKHLFQEVAEVVRRLTSENYRSALDWVVATLAAGQDNTSREFRRRFQQLSSAVMAKAVEDTLFYRWHAMIALNEVGCDPRQPARRERWHAAMMDRLQHQPNGLLATATHDTKHGEDARARLYSLSERPSDWICALRRWRSEDRTSSRAVGVSASDAELEWLLYQSLASIWPSGPAGEAVCAELLPRLVAFLEKALREAKLHTSWTDVNADYERQSLALAERLLHPDNRSFLEDFGDSLRPVILAGWINSLAQTLLKLTVPGIPDIYQGSEVADFSLVDPDNRRRVDFTSLARSLAQPLPALDEAALVSGYMKQKLVALCLSFRRAHSDLFVSGSYEPLQIVGARADKAVAFMRRREAEALVVIVPRRTFGSWWPSSSQEYWRDTHVLLPPGLPLSFCDVLSGAVLHSGTKISLGKHLAGWPVSLMAWPGP